MFSLQGTDGNMCGERTYGLFNKSKNNVRVWEREVSREIFGLIESCLMCNGSNKNDSSTLHNKEFFDKHHL